MNIRELGKFKDIPPRVRPENDYFAHLDDDVLDALDGYNVDCWDFNNQGKIVLFSRPPAWHIHEFEYSEELEAIVSERLARRERPRIKHIDKDGNILYDSEYPTQVAE